MTGMLQALQRETYKSLEVFIDGDILGGDMVDIIDAFSEVQRPQWGPYEKMKLLVFRCEFPHYLTFEDESRGGPAENSLRSSVTEGVEREHPIWHHISTMYAYFSACDCIFIETKVGGGEIPSQLWQLASERIFCQAYRQLGAMGSLQYLIVGNNVDGYYGIQGVTVDIKVGQPEKLTWRYLTLSGKDCRKLISDRSH
jgi:hypothetical protein